MKKFSTNVIAYPVKIIAFAIIYHIAVRLGLQMAYLQPNTSPVWPPTGIAIALLFILGLNYWPGIALGVFGGSLLTGALPSLALGMTIGNTLEAVVAVYILTRRLTFSPRFDRLNDIVAFSLVSFFCTLISASVGSLTLLLTTGTPAIALPNIFITWWIGDLLGALVVAPVILVWKNSPLGSHIRKHLSEALLLMLVIILVSWYVFSKQPPIDVAHQAMIYVLFPFVIWAALRFGPQGAVTTVFLISMIAIWGTIHGYGPFVQAFINESLIIQQTFMGVVSLTALILGATIQERRMAARTLQQRIEDLDTLNNASKSFLSNSEKSGIYQAICRIGVEKFNAASAWIEIPSGEKCPATIACAVGISTEEISSIWKINQTKSTRLPASDRYLAIGSRSSFLPTEPVAFPLIFGKVTLGILNLVFSTPEELTGEKTLLIQSYANLSAVAVQNAWLFDEVSRGNEQLHALSQRLMKAQEEERLHLSRELHDESGQILAALMVELGLLRKSFPASSRQADGLEKIHQLSQDLQDNLHRLAANLRPASLDHLGLVKSLEQYTADFSRQHSIAVDFEAVGLESNRLPTDIETSLFRIIQESLTNVALHAAATHVDVLLSCRNHHVVAVVEDDGVGFIPAGPAIEKQLGLFGMRERVEMLQGTFTLESEPGKGTIIKVEVPFEH